MPASGDEARNTVADVIVVGAGNAALTAAHAAAVRGRRVLVLEKAQREQAGGNSYYTAGATRIAHGGLEDLLGFLEPDERHVRTEVPPYSPEEYASDIEKVTEGRNDPELTRVLAEEAGDGVRWLHSLGLKYRLMYERQAYERPDGSYLFWGGLHVGNVGGGVGLMGDHLAVADRLGVRVRYGQDVAGLIVEDGAVRGVEVRAEDGSLQPLHADSVILAAGGFESNAEWRRAYLGEEWSRAKVRGTRFNRGEMLMAALEIGAARGGDWTSCHSVQWDAFHPKNESNRELTNRLTRQGYPLGILVNQHGERFLDEGENFRNYTYAKYGGYVLKQPDAIAYQIFDSTVRPLLREEEYDMPGISVRMADSVEGLAVQAGIDPVALRTTVDAYNSSIDTSVRFDPSVRDGLRAATLPPKSNWASPLVEPPYYAYPVTCGITFTFGGLKTDAYGRVLSESGVVIPGLFTCGEMLGGLFSSNYPGGSGLAAGIVFGRRAGSLA